MDCELPISCVAPDSDECRISNEWDPPTEMVGQVHLYALSDPRETREVRKSYSLADQANNIASPIQNGSAVFARIKMFFNSLAERGLHGLIDVVRQWLDRRIPNAIEWLSY
jgi:hypothetical protein